jgi:hypothetical protein
MMNDTTTPTKPLTKGDKVRLAPGAITAWPRYAGLVGTVAHAPRRFPPRQGKPLHSAGVAVRWPGRSAPVYHDPAHLLPAAAPAGPAERRLADGVERLLVSGADDDLMSVHFPVAYVANAVERRGRTVFYTVMAADLEAVLAAARAQGGVTVQRRVEAPAGSPPEAYWPVAVKGRAAPWTSADDERGDRPEDRE